MSDFVIRKWSIEDAHSIGKYANNINIACNLRDAFPYPYTLDDAKAYINGCIEKGDQNCLCRAIEVNGEAVGSIGVFIGTDVYRKSGELGYWLAEDYWGKGIMTKAVEIICDEAFHQFDIVRIFAEPFARNAASKRVLEKAGFTLEGIMRNGVYKQGEIMDYCIYSLIKK